MEEPFLGAKVDWPPKANSGVAEDGMAVEAIIRGFPVLTGLTEPSWCWVSIQTAGQGFFVVLFERV